MPVVVNKQGGSPGEPPCSRNGNREGYPDFSNAEALVWLEKFPASPDPEQHAEDLRALGEGLALPPRIGAVAVRVVAPTDESCE